MRNPLFLALSAATLLSLGALAPAQTAIVTSTTTTDGTVSEFSPETIVVRSESSPDPVRYSFSKTVTYVDDAGEPVAAEVVKSGLPVTVHYVREGDRTVASRIVVHRKKSVTTIAPAAEVERTRTTTVAPAAAVERTVTTVPAPAPVLEEKRTTTTTTTTTK